MKPFPWSALFKQCLRAVVGLVAVAGSIVFGMRGELAPTALAMLIWAWMLFEIQTEPVP